MRALIIIIAISFLQCNEIFCQSKYGNVFPIPLTILNDDPNFINCSRENGVYSHTINCSLFHLCNFGIHTIYSCIDGYFFNPHSGQCQHLLIEKEVKCETIVEKMMDTNILSFIESIKEYDYHDRRKSATSTCTQTGIYPDILDCSLFHYCHENKHHQIYKCPNRLNFDPKTFMCLAPQLVNCQYEPPRRTEDEIDTICRGYAPGTYLPVPNRFDIYIICGNDNRGIPMKCKSGFIYNGLTTACEKGPCTFDSTLCKNEGQCIDQPSIVKGFKCICSSRFQGEYCEKAINLKETTEEVNTKETIEQSSDNPIRFDDTTHVPYIEKVHSFRKNKPMVTSNVQQDTSLLKQQQFKNMLSIIIVVFIGLIILGSIIYAVVTWTRFGLFSPMEFVGTWKTLSEESNV